MNARVRAIIVAVVIVGAAGIGKNLIAQAAITGGVKAMTGLDLTIRSMHVGVLRSIIGIRGLTLDNPSGFQDRVMVDLPEAYIDYDLGALFQQRVHLREVRLHLNEFAVIKDRQGRVNLDALKVVQESKGKPAAAKPAAGKTPEIQIDVLQLKIGRVVFKDYSLTEHPIAQEFPINIDERYEHITNPQVLAGLIVSRALMNTTVAKLTGVDVTALQANVTAQMKQAAQMAAGAAKAATAQVSDAAINLGGTAKGAAQDAANAGKAAAGAAKESVQKTAETLKKILPFGN